MVGGFARAMEERVLGLEDEERCLSLSCTRIVDRYRWVRRSTAEKDNGPRCLQVAWGGDALLGQPSRFTSFSGLLIEFQ